MIAINILITTGKLNRIKYVNIFDFKKRVIPTLKNIPYVEGDSPVIFSWYPTAGKALLWNVNEQKQKYNVKRDGKIIRSISIEGLDVELIEGL